MEQNDGNQIIVQNQSNIVQPAVTAEQGLEQFKAFQNIKEKCLSAEDKQQIKGKPYIMKSGWRKIKTLFNLTEEILESRRDEYEVKDSTQIRWVYRVRVSGNTSKGKVYSDAEMACDTTEAFAQGKPETILMAMAQTRAFNRAISDLVGGGEVSAEEMIGDDIQGSKQAKRSPLPEGNDLCSLTKKKISEKEQSFSIGKYGISLSFEAQKKVDSGMYEVMDMGEKKILVRVTNDTKEKVVHQAEVLKESSGVFEK